MNLAKLIIVAQLLAWGVVHAVSLGNLQIQSAPSQAFKARVEILEAAGVADLSVALANAETYARLGIAASSTQAQLQLSLEKDAKGQATAVVIQSPEVLKLAPNEVFLDALIELRWSAGLVRRAYTLLVGDQAKIQVKAGETLSDIATRVLPQFEGANFDQALIALYRTNPQAFVSGSIHRLAAGAQLQIPSAATVQSVPVKEAQQITQAADQAYRRGQASAPLAQVVKEAIQTTGDRLQVGPAPGASGEAKRRMEELLVQEKALADAKQRIVELEKNIADLKKLIAQGESAPVVSAAHWLNYGGPLALAVFVLLALIVLLKLSKNDAKQREAQAPMPAHAAQLFASLDLNLNTPAPAAISPTKTADEELPSAETLRVKLNLVRAYITIEDFGAARRSLDEILAVSNQVDPDITIAAKALIAQIDEQR